ncbi:MAG: ATP-binding protein [Candidatus Omnitrophota bacterium]
MQHITLIYIVTILVSIAIAFFLSHVARMSSQAKVREGAGERHLSMSLLDEDALKKTISDGICEVVESKQRRREISKAVSDIFANELEKRVELNTQELDKKYNSAMEQKTQSEEIAWKKYMKVLAGKKETDAVIRSIAEGLLVVDGKGNVVMMNPAAEKLLDVSKNDKIGKPMLENIKKEQIISMAKSTSGGKDKEIEIFSEEDETKKVLRSSSAVIEDENGQTVGMVSVLSDVTKQKELDLMKSKFVANVTHELRTPLVAIQKSISLLLSKTAGDVSSTQEEFLTLADRNIKKLSRLIDDLLDLAKLESGKMQVKPALTTIGSVIREAAVSFDAWANTKSIKIEERVQEGLPDVNIDAQRIGQILNNLIGNAIKFTPHGGMIIVEAVSNNMKEIEVSVQDNGPGIPKEDLDKVFDRFYQTGERNLSDISGTGVGLSIAREIAELHGGKIWVESEKKQGAKFIFTLPIIGE